MKNSDSKMSNLFLQLGLDADENAIEQFIKTHQLDKNVGFYDAPFWSPSQLQFFKEQIKADATWAIVIDQLNESLHKDALNYPPP